MAERDRNVADGAEKRQQLRRGRLWGFGPFQARNTAGTEDRLLAASQRRPKQTWQADGNEGLPQPLHDSARFHGDTTSEIFHPRCQMPVDEAQPSEGYQI